jgi:hypothetical protein
MIRRTFLIIVGMLGLGFMAIFSIESSFIKRLYYKIEGLFKSPAKLPPDSEKLEAELSPEGETVSVEMALNSRCTSDYDGNSKKFHWGMFDGSGRLSETQIKKIIHLARIPRFTGRKVEIQCERNMLTFVIDNHASGLVRDWMMVESGMQQQAIALVCAALGVGMVFRGLGEDGAAVSDTDYGTVKVKLDAMKPTYDGSFWSSLPPAGTKSWLRGNLSDPVRDGNEPLISVLENMKIENRSGRNSTDESVSQFLWAARGRTPHFYKSRPWGMTVPTSGGEQNASSVYLIRDDKLFKYVNWHKNRPTHSLETLGKIDLDVYNQLMRLFPFHNSFIVIGKNIDFATALWEVGYQLLNLVLQAQALGLGLGYEAILLDENQKEIFRSVGIKDPVSAFLLRHK